MSVELQGLEFQITAQSSEATKKLTELKTALTGLKTAASGGVSGIGTLSENLTKLNNAMKGTNLDSLSSKLTRIGNALKLFGSNVSGVNLSASIGTNIGKLGTGLSSITDADINKLAPLASGLSAIGAVASGATVSATIGSNLESIAIACMDLTGNEQAKLQQLATGLTAIGALTTPHLTGYINQLSKFPAVIQELRDADIDTFATQIQNLATALEPLATQMERVSSGFAAFPSKIKEVTSATTSLNKTISGSGGLLSGLKGIAARYLSVYALARALATCINASNEYQENLNLFTVALGNYADEAKEYAETVANAMGIDSAEWLRNEGVFNTLLTGFGNVENRAVTMSKNLTQLGYDLSSFFNISVSDAMTKLQSGISGELEPLRRLGFDLSDARLKATALSLGIDKATSSMTQAEKAELRYYAIMTQVTRAQGDMARSINTPANQLRILKSQFTQLARAVGNIFIPALNAILPVVTAVVQALRDLAQSIANFFGFKLTEVDYSGISTSVADSTGETADNLSSAAGSAKKLKQYTMGLDELNVFNEDDSGGGGGGGGSSGLDGSGWDFELPEYDFLNGITSQIEDLKEKIKPILDMVIDIGEAFLLWKLASSVIDAFGSFLTLIRNIITGVNGIKSGIDALKLIAAGVILLNLGLKWVYDSSYKIGYGDADLIDYIKLVFGTIAAGVGGSLIGVGTAALTGLSVGAGAAVGAAIGIGLAIVVGVVGYSIGKCEAIKDSYLQDFYNSDAGKEFTKLKEEIENNLKLSIDLSAQISSLNGSIDDDTLAKLNTAQELINEIFTIDSEKNLTDDQIALIKTDIETLNSLGLDGLSLAFDDVTGHVSQTYDATQKVLDNLWKTYEMEALKEDIIEAYKTKNTALTHLNEAYDEQQRLLGEVEDLEKKSKENEDEHLQILKDINEEYSAYYDGWTYYQKLGEEAERYRGVKAAEKTLWEEIETQVSQNEQSIQNYGGAYKEAEDKLVSFKDRFTELSGELEKSTETMTESGKSLSDAVADGITDGTSDVKTAIGGVADAAKSEWDSKTKNGAVSVYNAEGGNIMQGLGDGITDNLKTVTDAMGGACDNLLDTERAKNGINSPSTVYADEGMYLMQGFAKGITDHKDTVVTAMTTMLNELIKKVNTFVKNCSSALGDLVKDYATTMNSLKVSESGTVSYTPMSVKTVSTMANGGFVDEGQLFIAREAGAEMVGRVGSKTAVANNDQIVTGIATGVSSANTGVINAIYTLIDAVQDKDFSVNIGDEQIGRANDRYTQKRGVRVNSGAFANAY